MVPQTQPSKDADQPIQDYLTDKDKTFAINKENLSDETPPKTQFEGTAKGKHSTAEKPVEKRDTDASVQDQSKNIQDELFGQRVSLFSAFSLNSCNKSQNLIQY